MRAALAPALASLALVLCLPASAQQPPPAKPAAKAPAGDPKADGSYSLGVSIGNQLRSLGLNKDSVAMERVTAGLRDALAGSAQATPEHVEKVNALIEQGRNSQAASNKTAAQKFLADNGKKKDVTTTASGLQYRIVAAGAGNVPKPSDEVTVHYRGMLLDGTEFDSSIRRGQPATFPVKGVIQGWQEALVLMKPGSKYELFIPPELAYGANSEPPIPPNSLLKFDVELISIKPAAAAAPPPPAPKK